MNFYFCETCGKRLTDHDLAEGQGRNKKLKGVFCKECAVGVMTLETIPISDQQARKILGKTPAAPARAVGRGASERRLTPADHGTKSGAHSRPPAPSKRNIFFLGVALGVGLLLLAILGWALTRDNERPEVRSVGKPALSPANPAASTLPPAAPAANPPEQVAAGSPGTPALNPVPEPERSPEQRAQDAFETLSKELAALGADRDEKKIAALEAFLKEFGDTLAGSRARTALEKLKFPDPAPKVAHVPAPSQPASTANEAVELTRGLVGYWALDEGSGTVAKDRSGRGNEGALINGPTYVRLEKSWFLNLDGKDDCVHIPPYPSLDLTTALSLCVRLKWTETGNGARGIVVKDYGKNKEGFGLYLEESDNTRLQFAIRAGETWSVLTCPFASNDGQWHYVFGTYDGAHQRLWVDGKEVAAQAVSGLIPSNKHPVRLGGFKGGGKADHFPGSIDGVRIYSRALNAAEIRFLAGASAQAAQPKEEAPARTGEAGDPEATPAKTPPESLTAERVRSLTNEWISALQSSRGAGALEVLDRRSKDPAFIDASAAIDRARKDVSALMDLRRSALVALGQCEGKSVTLSLSGKPLSGVVRGLKTGPALRLEVAKGTEMSITADQLDAKEVEAWAPKAEGGSATEDLRRRGLLYLVAQDVAKARQYFERARDAEPRDSVAHFLDWLREIELGDAEARAVRAWEKAESHFQAKAWKEAANAYDAFAREFPGSKAFGVRKNLFQERNRTLDAELNRLKPGLWGRYHKGLSTVGEKEPAKQCADGNIDFRWEPADAASFSSSRNDYHVLWTGYLKVPKTGHYTFYAENNNKLTVQIGDNHLIDSSVLSRNNRTSAEMELTEGRHPIRVAFDKWGAGAAQGRLSWSLKEGFAKQPIPAEAFGHDPADEKKP